MPVPVDGPLAHLSGIDGARGTNQVGASVGDLSGELDGLVQLVLIGATEDQATAGVEVLDVVGWKGRR